MNSLLKTQKNEMYSTLVSSGIDEAVIRKIKWLTNASKYRAYNSANDDDGGGIALILDYDGNTFFFYFNGSADRWIYVAFPMGITNGKEKGYNVSWVEFLKQLSNWGKKISAELNTPDLWLDMQNIKSGYSFDYEEFKDNEPITAEEAHAIKSKLKILEHKVIEDYGKSDENIKIIKEKFTYLYACIERQGKKDWLYTLIGVLSSLAIAIGVSASNADKFWLLVKAVLGSSIKLLLGS
jgi:hypothetical protein